MKRILLFLSAALLLGGPAFAQGYVPTPENLAQRADFQQHRLGIFLHWGIYATYTPASTTFPTPWRPRVSIP